VSLLSVYMKQFFHYTSYSLTTVRLYVIKLFMKTDSKAIYGCIYEYTIIKQTR